ncbi:MAG: hypothetical protein H0U70_09340 [Tatlockia sp.]|nr:hypothetical protein [Tatlockia sp.]
MNSFLTKNLIKSLDAFQSRSLSTQEATLISQTQDRLINDSLSIGIANSLNKEYSSHEFSLFLNYFKKILNGKIISGNLSFKKEQDKIYSIIHSSSMTDCEKIFFEFILGLARFTLAIQMIDKFVYYLSENKKIPFQVIENTKSLYEDFDNKNNFIYRVSKISTIGSYLVNAISEYYTSDDVNTETYWTDVETFFRKNKHLHNLAQSMVSIQYIPRNGSFLSVMQTMHWRGFGGTGKILLQHEELKNLSEHAINHHLGYSLEKPSNKKMIVFKAPLDAMLKYTQASIVAYLNTQISDKVINLHDFCSGPHYVAVKGIFEKMPNRTFQLTISDVDGENLALLIKQKEDGTTIKNMRIIDVLYEDLMLIKDDSTIPVKKYHFVSANLGLHQLPLDSIYTVLRYFAKITKNGGLISNLDASNRSCGQLMVIPGNLVDREGHVPEIEHLDLSKLVSDDIDGDYLIFPYPLVNFSKKVLENIDNKIGVGPYMVSFYTPIKIKSTDFYVLNDLWKAKNYYECDSLIRKYLPNIHLLH